MKCKYLHSDCQEKISQNSDDRQRTSSCIFSGRNRQEVLPHAKGVVTGKCLKIQGRITVQMLKS